jgi:uncharacterized membrane protein YbhN (UPF0104 family)
MPIVAVALLAITGSSTVALLIPALVGVAILVGAVVVFALLMWKKAFARRIGAAAGAAWSWLRRLVHKPPVTGWDEAAVRFRRQSNDLVARRWPALTLTTLVSHVGLYLVFLLTTRLVGITAAQVSWVELLGIFSLGRLLTAAPITPGGVGLAEVVTHAVAACYLHHSVGRHSRLPEFGELKCVQLASVRDTLEPASAASVNAKRPRSRGA